MELTTHADLVRRAARWLRNTRKCTVVLTEMVSASPETPDAIGWQAGRSVLVECKTSRSDFRRDRKKWFRRGTGGMGAERWYMAPRGVIPHDDVPEGWGLLEAHQRVVAQVIKPAAADFATGAEWLRLQSEQRLLLSALRRLQDP